MENKAHTVATSIPEIESLLDIAAMLNERRAAEQAVIAAAREILTVSYRKHHAWSLGCAFDGDLLNRAESELAHALANLDALTAESEPQEGEPAYKRARGILAPADEPAEVSIRRLRDGTERRHDE